MAVNEDGHKYLFSGDFLKFRMDVDVIFEVQIRPLRINSKIGSCLLEDRLELILC